MRAFLKKLLTYEPVMNMAFFTSLLAAVALVLQAFNVYRLTQEQITAILAIITALYPIVGMFVRQSVKPMAKIRKERQAGLVPVED